MTNGIQYKVWRIIENETRSLSEEKTLVLSRKDLAAKAEIELAYATQVAETLVKLGAIERHRLSDNRVYYSRKPAPADGLQRDEWIDNMPYIGERKIRTLTRERATAEDGTRFVRVNLDEYRVDALWRIDDSEHATLIKTLGDAGASKYLATDDDTTDEAIIKANIANVRERMRDGRIAGDETSIDDLECLLGIVDQYISKK